MPTVPRPRNAMVTLIDELVRTHGRLKSVFANVNAAAGLSAMESTALAAVIESSVPPTVPQIGRSLGHARQVIQRAAHALIGAGLIEARPNPSHKRAPLLLPTQQGRNLKRQSDARAEEATAALLRRIDAAACRRMAGQLRDLREEIEDVLRAKKTPARKTKSGKKNSSRGANS
jgi:DNA-binding MarR family transcriptional regulator